MRLPSLWTVAAITCAAVALVLDLLHWAWPSTTWPTSEWWRFIRTIAAAGSACGLVVSPVLPNRLLAIAMGTAVVADGFLIIRADLVTGVAVFAVMQLLLIGRHAAGRTRHTPWHRHTVTAAVIAALVVIVGNAALWPALAPRGLAWPVLGYSLLLMMATVTALSVNRAAWWGMVLFVVCDVTVGIGAAYGDSSAGQLIRATTGVFYTPALLLLVASRERHV